MTDCNNLNVLRKEKVKGRQKQHRVAVRINGKPDESNCLQPNRSGTFSEVKGWKEAAVVLSVRLNCATDQKLGDVFLSDSNYSHRQGQPIRRRLVKEWSPSVTCKTRPLENVLLTRLLLVYENSQITILQTMQNKKKHRKPKCFCVRSWDNISENRAVLVQWDRCVFSSGLSPLWLDGLNDLCQSRPAQDQ